VYPGVNSMLEKLHSDGFKLGIVSQKGRDFEFEGYRAGVVVELRKLSMLSLFSVIIGFEDVTRLKPDPEGINLALSKLKSSRRRHYLSEIVLPI